MVPIGFHMGLRQVVMALMNWAIDVPLELNKVMQYPLSLRSVTLLSSPLHPSVKDGCGCLSREGGARNSS